jgi:hypothetical protein
MIRTVLRDRFRRVWVILAGMTALFSVEAVVIMIHDGIAVSGCVLTPHRPGGSGKETKRTRRRT